MYTYFVDIENINDFLIQHATGKTKAQIDEEVKKIKLKTAELKRLISDCNTHTEILSKLQNDLSQLENKIKIHSDTLIKLEQAQRQLELYAITIPNLKIEHSVLESQLSDFKEKEAKLQKLEQCTRELIDKNQQATILADQKTIEMKDQEKVIDLKTLKLNKTMEENLKAISLIELNKQPVHFYIKKIQKILTDKKIDIDILKELNIVV
jgi:Asp-tRNA(Asn)/Glu-tRNA(Gln) amidotransferase A subunit family amidase